MLEGSGAGIAPISRARRNTARTIEFVGCILELVIVLG